MIFFATLTAILLLAPAAGPAQEPAGQTGAENYKFSVRSNLVFLPTRVQSKKGETIYGLTPEQFIVEDNGVRQSVEIDDGPDSSGVSLVVAIQCSRSAAAEFHKIKGLGAMIGAIVGAAPHEVSIVSYGAGPYLLGDFSSRAAAVSVALSKLRRCDDNGAASIDTVGYAINMLKRRPNHYRRAILLIGETRDHGSRAKLDEVVAELGITDTAIYSVAFSPTRDQFLHDFRHGDHPPPETNSSSSTDQQPSYTEKPPLFELPPEILLLVNALRRNAASELASLSGGEYANFTTQRGFDDSLQRISNRIHNYYLLSFKPAPSQGLGLHTLRVRVPDHPDAVIQTRKSYWPGVPDARP